MFSFHLFIINIGKRGGGRGAKIKNAHRRIQRFTGWVAPVLAMHPTLATKKKKKVQLFWHRCFGHKIPTLLFICLFSLFVFICSYVLEVSPSHFTPWPHVCVPVQKKGRFVVVLSSHLRCSPFKRHRFSYKLCDCEWVGRGGVWEGGGAPCAPTSPPCTPFMLSEYIPSPLLRARSAAQLLQHFPLAKIVLFNEHAETAFRPRFFICFPQTRKKRYRRSLEGWGKEREMCTHIQTHIDTRWNHLK